MKSDILFKSPEEEMKTFLIFEPTQVGKNCFINKFVGEGHSVTGTGSDEPVKKSCRLHIPKSPASEKQE